LQSFDRRQQVPASVGLKQKAACSSGQYFPYRLFRIVYGQDQDASFGQDCEDLSCGIQPVEVRHTDIQQENVWFQLAGTLYGFTPVSGLTTNLPSGMSFEQGANTFSRHFVVIRNQDSKAAQALPPGTRITKRRCHFSEKAKFCI
jgi:hypothetical protein